MSAAACPSCNQALPPAVVNGPAQAVVRCAGCQTLLLWSNGRVMRSARSTTTRTMTGMPAGPAPGTVAAKTAAPPPKREIDAPLAELKPEAEAGAAKPVTSKLPATKTATSGRVTAPKQSASGFGDNVPTRVSGPPAGLSRKQEAAAPAPAQPMKTSPSGAVKVGPTAPPRKDATPPPAATPTLQPPEADQSKPQLVAAVAKVPQMPSGPMVDPSVWFAGDASDVVQPERLPPLPPPLIASSQPARSDPTGAPPLPPPPELPPLAEPFEIDAPGSEPTPAAGTLLSELRPKEPSAPIAVGKPAATPLRTSGPTKRPVAGIRGAGPVAPGPKTAPVAPGPKTTPLMAGAKTTPVAPGPKTPLPPAAGMASAPTIMAPAAEPNAPMPSATDAPLPSAAPPPPMPSTPTPSVAPEPNPPTAAANAPVPVEYEVSSSPSLSPAAAAPVDSTAQSPLPELEPEIPRLRRPLPRRSLLIAGGSAGGLLLIVLAVGLWRGSTKPAAPPAPPPPPPAHGATTTTTTPAPPVAEPPAAPQPAAAPSAAEPKTPEAPRPHRTLGGKKVVLEYDPKPTSPTPPPAQVPTPMGEDPAVVARAREAYHRGNVKLFAGDSQGAIALYRESLQIYPGYVAGYRGLGLGYEAAGNAGEALKAFRTYVRTVPNANDVPLIRKRIDRLQSQK